MKNILGLDIGYGDVKICFISSNGEIKNVCKFPSAIGITKKNEYISDSRVYEFHDNAYYVGDDALKLPSENLVDITEYKNLEFYAPLFAYKAIQIIGEKPDYIATGLSKAQLQNSGYFKDALTDFEVNGEKFHFDNLFVLPQGAGSKLAIDKYGADFPKPQTEFTGSSTYVGVDIGMNTIDAFLVSDGKTNPNLFEGVEHEGVMKIARAIAKKVEAEHGRKISLQEAKNILLTNTYKLRGERFDFSEAIREIKKEYLKGLMVLIEQKWPGEIDKSDFIFLCGGGSSFFNSVPNASGVDFIRVPKSHHEFYNAIGFAHWIQDKFANDIKG